MKKSAFKRIFSLLLALVLVACLVPMKITVEANALSLSGLTCSAYISNARARSYIDTMMRYYINNNSDLQSMLTSGKCVVFMFEGGSDNYWNGETYEKSLYDNRIQAAVFVVKADASGNAYIDYCSETCSSIASNVLDCTAGVGYSGSTTILDGVYRMYRWNHTGPYASFQLDVDASNANGYGLYTPSSVPDGQLLGCNGINVHTRSTTSGTNWSAGCQVIGTGAYTSNEYNAFFRSVTGFGFDPWVNYYSSPKTLYSYGDHGYGYGSGYTVGYYVVDRQLAMIGTDGVQYGSGSLVNVFNKTALSKLTSYSTPKAQAAGALNFEYSSSQCSFYSSHCQIKVTLDGAPVNSQPCSVSTAFGSSTLETATVGKTYTATGLYKNHYGNYWYRVTTSSGKTGYIYAGETQYVKTLTSDITLTGATAPNGHVQGKVFVVNGTINSPYNELIALSCFIYNGFTNKGDPVTGTAGAPTGPHSYTLASSTIDNATAMNELATGNYTYQIQAAYRNYYATSATEISYKEGTLELMKEYFAVVPSSVDQSSCAHSNTTHVLQASTCQSNGSSLTVCSKCGKIAENVTTGGHSYGSWSTTKQPTCTATGTQQRTCTRCNNIEYKTLAATGHSYETSTIPATCQEHVQTLYTCSKCNDQYTEYPEGGMSAWSETKPDVDPSLIEQKTQYRYSDYETKTSYDTSMSGYTQKSSTWVQSGTGTVNYVKSWPSGFLTTNTYYTQYNGQSKKVTTSETETTKTVVDSDAVVGYLWHHWCYSNSYYSVASKSGSYTTFHAFYSSADNSTDHDSSDDSYEYANSSCCSNSDWYWKTPVYAQKYTTYKKQFTYERWKPYTEWSDTAVTASSTRKVETRTVYRYVNSELAPHTWVEGICTVCGEACAHSYVDKICTECGMPEPNKDYYLFGWINGNDYACEADHENTGIYKFEEGKLTAIFETDSYVGVKLGDNSVWYMTNGYPGDDVSSATLYDSAITGEKSDRLFVPRGREITFSLTENGDGSLTLSYVAAICEHPSHGIDGLCTKCGDAAEHTYIDGACTVCGLSCVHSWADGICTVCQTACVHNWKDSTCEICGLPCTHVYSNGYCTVCGHVCGHDWSDGTCQLCGKACEHSYSGGYCVTCGQEKPVKDYYLFGFINGANYGCEEDHLTTGIYKFVDGMLTVTFETTSYVAVKAEDNSDWYMTNGYPGNGVSTATLYNTKTANMVAEKLYVPGGVEVTFSLVDNGDDTFNLSYVVAMPEPVVQPTLTLNYPSLSFESEIVYNVYFTPTNIEDVVEMGLITFASRLEDGTIADAVDILPNAQSAGTMYMAQTKGIAAKYMGAALYFKVYAKLSDGSYVYSAVAGYNAIAYTNTIFKNSQSDEMKALCVAMLNYGAEAQKFFGHNVDSLMTAGLTAGQQALVSAYDASMVEAVVAVDAAKTGQFVQNKAGFTALKPTVSFEGAFAVNYYFSTAYAPENGMTMYYWTAADYAAADVLTPGNATGSMAMEPTGGTNEYWGAVSDIAAKRLDETIYVTAVYTAGGTTYCTGVIAYHIGRYCQGIAANDSSAMQDLAAATATYGYYAKNYFASIA